MPDRSGMRCEITLTPTYATLRGPDEAVRAASEALTVVNPKAKFTRAGKYGGWDGTTRFLRRPSNTFEAGLAQRVVTVLGKAGYSVSITGIPDVVRAPVAPAPAIEWRPYQALALDLIRDVRRLIIQAPTASGKTNIGIEAARRHGGHILWVVHTKVLLDQMVRELRAKLHGAHIGHVGDGTFELGDVTVGIVASLKNSTGAPYWQRFDMLIEDEAHHGGAETWVAVSRACVNAWTKVGLSGTAVCITDPVRALQMEGALGPVTVLTDSASLVGQGYLARPRIRFLRPPAGSYLSYEQVRQTVLPDWRSDPKRLQRLGQKLYEVAYHHGIAANTARNRLALQAAAHHTKRGERVLLLCRLRDHARHLQTWYRSVTDRPSWYLDGSPENKRFVRPVLEHFRGSNDGLLVATPFFREGVDVPEIDCFVNAAGGKAEIEVLQALGRALRPRPDKAEVAVYDFEDGGAETDRPEKDYLGLASTERRRIFQDQGFEVA